MRALLVFLVLALVAQALGLVIVVDDVDDQVVTNSECSLREAIQNANAGTDVNSDCADPGTDSPVVIELPAFVEASGLPDITVDTDIVPSGAAAVIQGTTARTIDV